MDDREKIERMKKQLQEDLDKKSDIELSPESLERMNGSIGPSISSAEWSAHKTERERKKKFRRE